MSVSVANKMLALHVMDVHPHKDGTPRMYHPVHGGCTARYM